MALFEGPIHSARRSFERLTQREQVLVLVGSAAAVLVILLGIGLLVSSAIGEAERRVRVKTDTLVECLALEGEYKAREQAQSQRIASLRGRANVRLVKIVEDAARNAGVEIGQLSPEEGQPNAEGIVESRVDLRAAELSIDRLQDFLSRLESSGGMVIVRRLKLNKPYRKDTLNIDMSVTTFRLEG